MRITTSKSAGTKALPTKKTVHPHGKKMVILTSVEEHSLSGPGSNNEMDTDHEQELGMALAAQLLPPPPGRPPVSTQTSDAVVDPYVGTTPLIHVGGSQEEAAKSETVFP